MAEVKNTVTLDPPETSKSSGGSDQTKGLADDSVNLPLSGGESAKESQDADEPLDAGPASEGDEGSI